MSVQTSASRPAGKSVGAATLGLLVTLAIFVVVFLAFLVAPLILLALAGLVYLVVRPRAARTSTASGSGVASSETTAHGFGAGTQ